MHTVLIILAFVCLLVGMVAVFTPVPPAVPAQTEALPALRSALQQLTVTLDGEAVGRLVASSVDAELGAAALGRRFG